MPPEMTEWEKRQYEKAGQGSPNTGLFKFGEVEYVGRSLMLRLDAARGVLYVDNATTGETVLRICRIPERVTQRIPHYGAVLDLQTAEPYIARVSRAREWKKAPVFLTIEAMSRFFLIETESGKIMLEVRSLPLETIRTLENREFTDITTGYTGRPQ